MDTQRRQRIQELLNQQEEHFEAIVCRLPQNVVMLTGYQPILGNSFCLLTHDRNGPVACRLAVPEDEKDLVPPDVADEVRTFSEETMDYIDTTIPAVRTPLAELVRSAHLKESAVVGHEGGYSPVATSYTQVGIPGPATLVLLHQLFLAGFLRDATPLLDELAAVKTEEELSAIRRAEAVGRQGFEAARGAVRVGAREADVAAAACAAMLKAGYAAPGARHVTPHAHVMAGPRSAQAYRAFNLTSNATINKGDPVTVQMEIGVNGYWAELTRTFFAGSISAEWRQAHQACVAAQDAALATIREGASVRAVDGAARVVMRQAGFGSAFKHGLGHGFGFQAINHAAAPVLHPASQTTLRGGMVHNMEPAVYLENKGGLRLNDNVAVRRDGCEVLSSALPRDLDWLVVHA
jgi:Xaa-Pro aminopeptidase